LIADTFLADWWAERRPREPEATAVAELSADAVV
jgi:hypothetical protein